MAVTSSGTATLTLPTDEQILITQEFDAPKHLVYKAWTTPELVKRWWHANRGEVTVVEIDLRVGGKWRYVMVAYDGFEVGFHGEYREIVPDERIVSHYAHPARAGQEQNIPRRDHRLRDGGRLAGRAGPPRADRDLASLIRQGTTDHRDDAPGGPSKRRLGVTVPFGTDESRDLAGSNG